MKNQELVKRETESPTRIERTDEEIVYTPDVDIIENDKDVTVIADIPGVDQSDIDLDLENNVLTIRARTSGAAERGELTYSEYRGGNYERTFSLSNQIDRTGVTATVKDGVLRIVLPKVAEAQARKITVKAS
jgi:HSP20 family molecular chaperone IbpA